MAQLKGPGAMTGVNLVVKTFDNNVTKDGKWHFLDAQVDARDARGPGQTNLHLTSERVKDEKTNQTRYNNGAAYSVSQFEKIREAAGTNVVPIVKDGKTIGAVFGVKANLMTASNGNGLLINTQTLAASDFQVTDATLGEQIESMKAARASRQTESPAAEVEAEGPGVTQALAGVVEATLESETTAPEPELAVG